MDPKKFCMIENGTIQNWGPNESQLDHLSLKLIGGKIDWIKSNETSNETPI